MRHEVENWTDWHDGYQTAKRDLEAAVREAEPRNDPCPKCGGPADLPGGEIPCACCDFPEENPPTSGVREAEPQPCHFLIFGRRCTKPQGHEGKHEANLRDPIVGVREAEGERLTAEEARELVTVIQDLVEPDWWDELDASERAACEKLRAIAAREVDPDAD